MHQQLQTFLLGNRVETTEIFADDAGEGLELLVLVQH